MEYLKSKQADLSYTVQYLELVCRIKDPFCNDFKYCSGNTEHGTWDMGHGEAMHVENEPQYRRQV